VVTSSDLEMSIQPLPAYRGPMSTKYSNANIAVLKRSEDVTVIAQLLGYHIRNIVIPHHI